MPNFWIDRSGEDDPDHVDERGHTGAGAFLDPGRVVVGGETAAAVVDGPVDARPPLGVEQLLPGDARSDELLGDDRAVVARRVVLVCSEPGVRVRSEGFEVDHVLILPGAQR